MSKEEIKYTVRCFADGAGRAQQAGLDGVETHSANGYLINQFLSSGINDRKDEYGGDVENRARFLVEIIRAIRKAVGDNFHVQAKISAVDHNNIMPWEKRGNTLKDSLAICQMVEAAGADAIHVSCGSTFPHPRNPAGDFPFDQAVDWYETVLSSGIRTVRNYVLFRYKVLRPIFRWLWFRNQGRKIEGINSEDAKAIKAAVKVPVIVTGGFQTASVIAKTIKDHPQSEQCADAVSIARPLIANNGLPRMFAAGLDEAPKPCTYCNKCLVNDLANPLGCYELCRYDGDFIRMMQEIMSVFYPAPVDDEGVPPPFKITPPPFAGLIAPHPFGTNPVPLSIGTERVHTPCKKYPY
jgi:2,4-dienoyl-CoA reductase (NADPH2)